MAAVDKNGNIITGNIFHNPFKKQVGDDIDEKVVNDLINPLHEKKRILDAAEKMGKKPTDLLEKQQGKLLTDDGREIINEG